MDLESSVLTNRSNIMADSNANQSKGMDVGGQGPSLPSGSGAETVYELGRSPLESPTSHVVSERVQTLASQIYNELQKIMNRCSDDEEAVSGLMPLVVNVLESLDISLIENQQLQVELELCKDDNEQLMVAFEKEKINKKKVDQRLIETEFLADEEKQHLQQQLESVESAVKSLELRAKNSADHSSRLEEKENELKTEYSKLHTRYTELLRSHCDLMERVKILIGNDDFALSSSGPTSLATTNALKLFLLKKQEMDQVLEDEQQGNKSEATSPMGPSRQAWIETDLSLEDASIIEDVDEIPKDRDRDRDQQSMTVADNFFGMEKEVENLILENNELMATKNALNIVKDDLIAKVDELQSELTMSRDEVQQLTAVKNRLKSRVSQLEDDFKKTKEELDEVKQKLTQLKEDDEEGIPMVQRKRFTRLEMARVLMERNQYKEKLIELQEAVRWTELIRASKTEGQEKKSQIWKFFSNLFTPSTTTPTRESPTRTSSASSGGGGGGAVKFSSNNQGTVTPALDAMRRRAKTQQSSDLVLLMDSDLSSERARALRNVRANVNRANGDRIQAYGWSIASTGTNEGSPNPMTTKHNSVPVPTYCRPLSGDDIGMKIWCASAVDLSGGEAGFPGNGSPSKGERSRAKQEENNATVTETGDHGSGKDSDSAIADLETELNLALNEQIETAPNEKMLSTFVWICSVSNSKSKVTIVNIRSNPSEVLDSFIVKTHLLCVASVPGAKNSDLQGTDEINLKGPGIRVCTVDEVRKGQIGRDSSASQDKLGSGDSGIQAAAEVSADSTAQNATLEKLSDYVAYNEPPSPNAQEEVPTPSSPVYQPMSTCLPTMWLGGQNKQLYVHSSIAQWSHCIASLKLPDSIVHITHFRGRVFIALANGLCCVFMRSDETGEWNFNEYYVVDIGHIATLESDGANKNRKDSATSSPTLTATSGIRCIEVTKVSVWLGYRNQVYILDPRSLKVIHTFSVHPRRETQVRQLTALGDGVWVSLRLDSTLRLYSAYKPYNHLQDIDIEPYVSKMLSPKAFSFLRITALKASNGRLWIGTANGVVLSIPCETQPVASSGQSVVSTSESGRLSVATFIPICNSSAAQLSFHGHRDSVKFFVCTKNLILSGGDGYIDFRLQIEDDTATGTSLSKGDRSHLIVWEINA